MMHAPKLILIPTDFSDVSQAALRYAVTLAGALEVTIHVLHVIEDPSNSVALADTYVLPDDFLKRVEQKAQERLHSLFTAAEQQRFRVQFATREGSPFVEIVRYARQLDIDLIVMGTHGRGPIAHMLLGSVAEQVVRKAPCPVLIARDPSQPFTMP